MSDFTHGIHYAGAMNSRKTIYLAIVLIAAALVYFNEDRNPGDDENRDRAGHTQVAGQRADIADSSPATGAGQIERLFNNRRSDEIVEIEARVARLLPDDNEGSRHQKFIVELESGHTVLVSHNIDLAPRIDALRRGDRVRIKGEYEWTERGGVIHWTHRDPSGRHVAGWIEHQGRRHY